MSIAEKVSELRKRNGYTLNHLHTLTGISLSYLSAIENGQRPNPSFSTMERLAQAFGVPLSYFSSTRSETDSAAANDADLGNLVDLAERICELYDKDTRNFLVSESSRPYLMLVQQLARQGDYDEPDLLQAIAQFIRDQKGTYPKTGKVPKTSRKNGISYGQDA